MNRESIERLLERLCSVKAAMRDTGEPSVNEVLDEVIAELQGILDGSEISEATGVKVWACLDKVLSRLPTIIKLIEFLSG